mgnify:CR=1 FL=1
MDDVQLVMYREDGDLMAKDFSTLSEPGWHAQPSLASTEDALWVAWTTFDPVSSSARIRLGRCVDGGIVPGEDVNIETGFALETSLIPDGTGGLWVLWVAAPTFAVEAVHYNPGTGVLSSPQTLSDRGLRCRNMALATLPEVGTWLLWEAWASDAHCRVAGTFLNDSGDWGTATPLTAPDRQAYWPTGTLQANGTLWIATSSPNPDRTGFDCILTCRTPGQEDAPNFCLNRAICGSFHLYPRIETAPDDSVWITWSVTTDQDYYALAGRGGNSEFCYLQDPASRARRSILWNVSVPIVRKVQIDGPILRMWQPEGTHPEDMRMAIGHLHHPDLLFSQKGELLLLARRLAGKRRCFETVVTRPVENSWSLPEAVAGADAPGALHITPVVSCRDQRSGRLVVASVSHSRAEEGHRSHRPEATSSLVVAWVDASTPNREPSSLQYVGPLAPMERLAREPSPAICRDTPCVGNLHIHTDLSRCRWETQQSLDLNYRWAMDLLGQDFTALTDHAEGLSAYQWERNRALANFYNFPGAHVALLAYEWVTASRTEEPCDGHVNVIFRSDEGQPFGSDEARSSSIERLWQCLEPGHALAIPHHTATFPFRREWTKRNDAFQRVLEIFQDRRGSYEHDGAPIAPGVACPEQMQEHRVAGGFALDALEQGHRIGFCSGGDHMGLSMTGIPTNMLTREALFDALYARHCYGTTHPDIRLHVTCLDAATAEPLGVMGDEIAIEAEKDVHIRAVVGGRHAVSEIALVGPGPVEDTQYPCTNETTATFVLRGPGAGETTWRYVRIMRNDGGAAWTSPIWLTGR